MTTQQWLLGIICTAALAGCRADPGNADYAAQESFGAQTGDSDGPTNELPGPDPWTPGVERLAIGAFYEGGSSDLVAINEVQTHLYIYENTMFLVPERDRVEGLESTAIEHGGGPWWGGGVHWDFQRDMSAWDTLHISMKADSASFNAIEIGMNDPNATHTVQASSYGWVADGAWHNLEIPLADLDAAGLSRPNVIAALVLLGGPGERGERVLVDNVYFSVQ